MAIAEGYGVALVLNGTPHATSLGSWGAPVSQRRFEGLTRFD